MIPCMYVLPFTHESFKVTPYLVGRKANDLFSAIGRSKKLREHKIKEGPLRGKGFNYISFRILGVQLHLPFLPPPSHCVLK